MKTSTKQLLMYLIAMAALFAATGARAEPWDDGAAGIQDIMYGPLGTTLAVIAVAGVGLAALFGKLDWTRAGMTIAGIIIFFAAPAIVSYVKDAMGSGSASAYEYAVPQQYAAVPGSIVLQRDIA